MTPFPKTPRTPDHSGVLLLYPFKKYYTQAGDQDDLISIGTIGLIKGVSTFRPDKNVKLATYASRCIENAILTQSRVSHCKFSPQRRLPWYTETKKAGGNWGMAYAAAEGFIPRRA